MDDERLKTPPVEGSGIPDYFDELLERIRDEFTAYGQAARAFVGRVLDLWQLIA